METANGKFQSANEENTRFYRLERKRNAGNVDFPAFLGEKNGSSGIRTRDRTVMSRAPRVFPCAPRVLQSIETPDFRDFS